MRFYDLLQLDPAVIKPKIRAAETVQERRKLLFAMVLRSLLIVLFAIVFIAPMSGIFGAENTPMAVAIFCILLGVRFVDLGYCIKDSMITLAASFLLLLVAPILAVKVNPLLAVLIHCAAFLAILVMTCHVPELGNGGLYSFAYIYLTGNPVSGELFWKRALLALLGYVLCGAILWAKHRHKHENVRFREVAAEFDLADKKYRWQLRMALGIALVLAAGNWFGVERFMWMGFACGSMLSSYPYIVDVKERISHRIIGAISGSLIFFAIYQLTPPQFYTLLGPVGGFCLGFCTDYRYKTAINCFGALMLAAGLYGIHGAVVLRILDTLLGVAFAFVYVFLFRHLVDYRYEMRGNTVPDSGT